MFRTSSNRFFGGGRRRRSGGYVLIALAISILVLIGISGLLVDLGRLYIVKNELQAYTDAAALAANQELDGTDDGVARARQKAATYPNKWNFFSEVVANPFITFAINPEGPYVTNPPSPPTGYKYTRVEAEGAIPLYFVPVFTSSMQPEQPPAALLLFSNSRATLSADSLTGQLKVRRFAESLLPYSPDAHVAPGTPPVYNPGFTEPDPFNFVVGKQYTLRWPPLGQREIPAKWCDGDEEANFTTPSGSAERGFIDIGSIAGSGGSSYIRQAIISNVQTHPLTVGEPVINVNGNRGTESEALRDRVNQDTDNYSSTYAEYSSNLTSNREMVGNGRRIVFVPVNNPFDNDRIIDFAAFFLPVDTEVCGSSNTAPCCAEYIGPGLLHGRKSASETIGIYATKLLK